MIDKALEHLNFFKINCWKMLDLCLTI